MKSSLSTQRGLGPPRPHALSKGATPPAGGFLALRIPYGKAAPAPCLPATGVDCHGVSCRPCVLFLTLPSFPSGFYDQLVGGCERIAALTSPPYRWSAAPHIAPERWWAPRHHHLSGAMYRGPRAATSQLRPATGWPAAGNTQLQVGRQWGGQFGGDCSKKSFGRDGEVGLHEASDEAS